MYKYSYGTKNESKPIDPIVNLELGLLAKKCGFKDETPFHYINGFLKCMMDGGIWNELVKKDINYTTRTQKDLFKKHCNAPTLTQLLRWVHNEYKIMLYIKPVKDGWKWDIYETEYIGEVFKDYSDALSDGLTFTLQNIKEFSPKIEEYV